MNDRSARVLAVFCILVGGIGTAMFGLLAYRLPSLNWVDIVLPLACLGFMATGFLAYPNTGITKAASVLLVFAKDALPGGRRWSDPERDDHHDHTDTHEPPRD